MGGNICFRFLTLRPVVNMLGFSVKIWTMKYQEPSNLFLLEDVHNFIFQDESFDSLVCLADTIKKIANDNADIGKIVSDMLSAYDVTTDNNLQAETGLIKNEVKVTEPIETVVKVEPDFNYDDMDEIVNEYKVKQKTLKNEKHNLVHTCEKCNSGFKWTKKLVQHLKECNPAQLTGVLNNLKPHVKRKIKSLGLLTGEDKGEENTSKQPKGPFFCEKCPQVFQKYPGFVSHVNAHELSQSSSKDKTEGEKSTIYEYELSELRDGVVMKCDKCDLAYHTFQTYKNHMDQFHKKALSCDECGLRFTLQNTLVKHKVDYH